MIDISILPPIYWLRSLHQSIIQYIGYWPGNKATSRAGFHGLNMREFYDYLSHYSKT